MLGQRSNNKRAKQARGAVKRRCLRQRGWRVHETRGMIGSPSTKQNKQVTRNQYVPVRVSRVCSVEEISWSERCEKRQGIPTVMRPQRIEYCLVKHTAW